MSHMDGVKKLVLFFLIEVKRLILLTTKYCYANLMYCGMRGKHNYIDTYLSNRQQCKQLFIKFSDN